MDEYWANICADFIPFCFDPFLISFKIWGSAVRLIYASNNGISIS